ncbi:MAG: hypothetical protein COA79_14805 [Planctomycetota bacterium]|nr:MAG: hypothetical protein COA79_14805 [Planctomycetota bacterium]
MKRSRISIKEVSDWILQGIKEKAFLPGDQLDSIRHLADKIGSSPLTVSRAVSQLSEEGFVITRPGKGIYVADPEGKNLLNSGFVGLLIHDDAVGKLRGSSLFLSTLPSVQYKLFQHNTQAVMLKINTPNSESKDFIQPSAVANRKFAGVIAFEITDLSYLMQLHNKIPNLIALDIDVSNLGIPCVAFDHQMASVDLVRKLHEMGKKNIHFIGGPFPAPRKKPRYFYDSCAKDRYDGWRLAMNFFNLEINDQSAHIVKYRSADYFEKEMKTLLESNTPLDAVITENANAVNKVLKEHGRDDIAIGSWSSLDALPPEEEHEEVENEVFMAGLDFVQLGEEGSNLMLKILEQPDYPATRKLLGHKILKYKPEMIFPSN